MGPTSTDPNCLTWFYYSSVYGKKDTNSGLVGPLLVCRKGSLGKDGKQVSQGTYVQVCLDVSFPETELQKKGNGAVHSFHFFGLMSPNSILSSTPDV